MTMSCQYLKTQLERIKKSLQKKFKDFGLEIAAESKLKIVNYVDVTLNLNDGSFIPCDKPDDIIQYINKECNHPPNLIRKFTLGLQKSRSKILQPYQILYPYWGIKRNSFISKVTWNTLREYPP